MKILLLIPPFTQFNTSYPSISYLKGFLNTLGIDSFQADLSLEVLLKIFSRQGLQYIFDSIEDSNSDLSENAHRIFTQRKRYINTIEDVIAFLQNKNPLLVHAVLKGDFLPKAQRFKFSHVHLDDVNILGWQDIARHLCTMYLEDIGDFISEVIDPNFEFSRYAERISRTATHFSPIIEELNKDNTIVSDYLLQILDGHMQTQNPSMVCISVPFPGNLFAALKCGQYIKTSYPNVTIVMGGGYVNTELRSIYDPQVFDYVDYITLDDGEAPLKHLIEFLLGQRSKDNLKRTFLRDAGVVKYINGSTAYDIPQKDTGTPDYSDLLLDKYISVIELLNPMHRLWGDGRWNKLTLAHGCYWGKCSFCDITIDYIKRYEPISPAEICDRIEKIISQTGQNGFHFVDEAAPPALLRDLSFEILRRNLNVVWWTNIRFEKSFTPDLCRLMGAAGCIAVSGGLEVASDRLLDLMKKGVTVSQVACVSKAFKDAGIMVHAYLMYGFPTQTSQETIDSLEIVRQMFNLELIDSGFWHQFAMTAHSPVGISPQDYKVLHTGPDFGGFAENDYFHVDPEGTDHEKYGTGLSVSLQNYMRGYGLDEDLQTWFEFDVPETKVPYDYIQRQITKSTNITGTGKIVFWIGGEAVEIIISDKKNKKSKKAFQLTEIIFSGVEENYSIYVSSDMAIWLIDQLEKMSPDKQDFYNLSSMKVSFEASGLGMFDDFYCSELFKLLRQRGLLMF